MTEIHNFGVVKRGIQGDPRDMHLFTLSNVCVARKNIFLRDRCELFKDSKAEFVFLKGAL